MSNLEIDAPLVNGDLWPIHETGESCFHAVEALLGSDFAAPPRSVNITVHTQSGKAVTLIIPYDHSGAAKVLIDGAIV